MNTRYVDFEVTISKRNTTQCDVLVDSPLGQAQGRLRLASNSAEFRADLERLQQGNTDTALIERIGEQLFTALFRNNVGTVYNQTMIGLQAEQRLRLILRMSQSEENIAKLPWEFLHDPNRGSLALHKTSIIRYLLIPSPPPTFLPRPPHPLKVLLTSAQPRDLDAIDADLQLQAIQDILSARESSSNVDIVLDPHLTRERFKSYIKAGFHLWHFVGHGDASRDGLVDHIYFEDSDGDLDSIGANDLGRRLAGSGLWLVFLNACGSARLGMAPFRSLASSLIYNGVPTVVGMHFPVTRGTADVFAQAFYEILRQGAFVDDCVIEGRIRLADGASESQPDWGTPIVYSRAFDMRLCDPSTLALEIFEEPEPPPQLERELLGKMRQIIEQLLLITNQLVRQDLSRENVHARTVQMIQIALLKASLEQYRLENGVGLGERGLQELLRALLLVEQGTITEHSPDDTAAMEDIHKSFSDRLNRLKHAAPPPVEPISEQYSDTYYRQLIEVTDAWILLPSEVGVFKCIEIIESIPAASRSRLFGALEIMAPAICKFHAEVVDEIAVVAQRVVELYP